MLRVKREHGLGLVIVDHPQLVQPEPEGEGRIAGLPSVCRLLKSLAKEVGVPLIALSRLDRTLEQRQDKRPVMSDLPDLDAIDEDADVVLFIYRDEVYNQSSPSIGTAEIIIAKHRNGPTGKIRLVFLAEYVKFEDYIPANSPPP